MQTLGPFGSGQLDRHGRIVDGDRPAERRVRMRRAREVGMRSRRRLVAIGLAILVLGVAAYAAAGLVAAQMTLAENGGCNPQHASFTPADFTANTWLSDDWQAPDFDVSPYLMPQFSEATFPARNEPSITIHAWWVPGPTADGPAVVVVHGMGSCRRDPTILVPAGMLHREGFGVLLIDMRDNGDSTREDGRYGFGSDEYRDVLGAWDWLVGQGVLAGRIGLFGESGGAAAVVVAMGEDSRVAAGWEEAGRADLATAAVEEARYAQKPEFLVPAAIFWMWVFGDDVINRSPLKEAYNIGTRPFQVVHGWMDERVAPHHAKDLEAALQVANPGSRAWLIAGAEHVQGPFLATAEYQRRLGEFFHAALGS
jgi:dipeptidyl aminopeptidase/acylaminoacyl peptidase